MMGEFRKESVYTLKQELRRQQTTSLLLNTVKELIREKGCEMVTMKDIMDRSGLSKGAIFHYVKSKDELFAWVLEERLQDIDERFRDQTTVQEASFEEPFREIVSNLADLQDPSDINNQVLVYLLGKQGQPEVEQVLAKFYELSRSLSQSWIISGQEAGVIPTTVHADKMGELFVLITLGLRMRAFLPGDTKTFQAEDFAELMRSILQGD